MKELFPDFLRDPAQYSRASLFWEQLWTSVCTSDEWKTGWLNTSWKDGTPFMDGDGILNAINLTKAKAFKVVQRDPSEAHEVHTWSKRSELVSPPVLLTVISGPLTDLTLHEFKSELEKLCR